MNDIFFKFFQLFSIPLQGMKPFAAMTWCVTEAHTKVLGNQVDRIIMQASMQARAYEPKIATRHVIGDWLIGPVQRLNDNRKYNL